MATFVREDGTAVTDAVTPPGACRPRPRRRQRGTHLSPEDVCLWHDVVVYALTRVAGMTRADVRRVLERDRRLTPRMTRYRQDDFAPLVARHGLPRLVADLIGDRGAFDA